MPSLFVRTLAAFLGAALSVQPALGHAAPLGVMQKRDVFLRAQALCEQEALAGTLAAAVFVGAGAYPDAFSDVAALLKTHIDPSSGLLMAGTLGFPKGPRRKKQAPPKTQSDIDVLTGMHALERAIAANFLEPVREKSKSSVELREEELAHRPADKHAQGELSKALAHQRLLEELSAALRQPAGSLERVQALINSLPRRGTQSAQQLVQEPAVRFLDWFARLSSEHLRGIPVRPDRHYSGLQSTLLSELNELSLERFDGSGLLMQAGFASLIERLDDAEAGRLLEALHEMWGQGALSQSLDQRDWEHLLSAELGYDLQGQAASTLLRFFYLFHKGSDPFRQAALLFLSAQVLPPEILTRLIPQTEASVRSVASSWKAPHPTPVELVQWQSDLRQAYALSEAEEKALIWLRVPLKKPVTARTYLPPPLQVMGFVQPPVAFGLAFFGLVALPLAALEPVRGLVVQTTLVGMSFVIAFVLARGVLGLSLRAMTNSATKLAQRAA